MSKAKTIGVWMATILPAAVLLMSGLNKLSDHAIWFPRFEHWGYAAWFSQVTGGIEVAGSLLMLFPLTSMVGAGLLACTMLGAILTHLRAGEYGNVIAPLVLLAFTSSVVYLRRDRGQALWARLNGKPRPM